jgi:hypothetical protein
MKMCIAVDATKAAHCFNEEAVFIGDSMVGIDEREGETGKTGNYKIKVAPHRIDEFTAYHRRKKKPASTNASKVQTK